MRPAEAIRLYKYTGGFLLNSYTLGDVVAQWLVRRTWDPQVESSSPGRFTHVVFLGKILNSHSASLHAGV